MPLKIVNLKNEKYDVYIGRGSKWGNPYSHLEESKAQYKTKTRAEAINRYEDWIRNGDGKYLLEHLSELENKTLGCFCKPKSCHGDVLIKLITEKQNPTLDFLK